MTDPIKPEWVTEMAQTEADAGDPDMTMGDPIKLPPFPRGFTFHPLVNLEAIKKYARLAVVQNITELRAELDTYKDSCTAKADRLDRLGEQIVALRARVAKLEAYASAFNNGLEAAADNQRKYNKHDVDADV
jgi:hypothetical protein